MHNPNCPLKPLHHNPLNKRGDKLPTSTGFNTNIIVSYPIPRISADSGWLEVSYKCLKGLKSHDHCWWKSHRCNKIEDIFIKNEKSERSNYCYSSNKIKHTFSWTNVAEIKYFSVSVLSSSCGQSFFIIFSPLPFSWPTTGTKLRRMWGFQDLLTSHYFLSHSILYPVSTLRIIIIKNE